MLHLSSLVQLKLAMQPTARRPSPWPGVLAQHGHGTARGTRPCLGCHPGPWHGTGTGRCKEAARWWPGAPMASFGLAREAAHEASPPRRIYKPLPAASLKALVWFWLIDETLSANLVYQSDYEIGSTTPSDEAMAKIMTMVMAW